MSAPAEYPLATVGRYGRRTHTITDLAGDRMLVVEGAGHLLLFDQPETVVEEIHAFLDA